MSPCLNEAHLINNISSEQLEATQKQDSFLIDCTMHDSQDMSVEVIDFNTSESSASHLPLNSAEPTSTNKSAMSKSESSSLHQTNSICSSTLD
eukprot:11708002-Ditylum_brightwellii.AAC.2